MFPLNYKELKRDRVVFIFTQLGVEMLGRAFTNKQIQQHLIRLLHLKSPLEGERLESQLS